jgi:hypothetical protein
VAMGGRFAALARAQFMVTETPVDRAPELQPAAS